MPKLIAQPAIENFGRARLYWFGRLGRQDIVRAFGVGTAYASRLVRKLHEELGSVRVGKGEVYPLAKQEIPQGVSSQRFLSDLYNAAVSGTDPTPQCGGEIAFSVIDAFRYNVPEQILRPIVKALESQGVVEIEYLGMNVGDVAKRRVIEPIRLVHVQGRWHINALCHEADGPRDFVLARILSAKEVVREVPADPMLDFSINAPTQYTYVPHPALSAQQRAVVEREFGMEDGQLQVSLSDGERFYFEQQFVAMSDADKPPVKLLVRAETAVRLSFEQTFMALSDADKNSVTPLVNAGTHSADGFEVEADAAEEYEFVIRYTDGAYNLDSGFTARLPEATRYPTREAAEAEAEGLSGVDCIERVSKGRTKRQDQVAINEPTPSEGEQ